MTEAPEHQHAELDELFDNLDLAEPTPSARLKDLLLGTDDDTLQKLEGVLQERIVEGHGEAVFELGFENNGESMALSIEQWNAAYTRLKEAAKRIRADCQTLITKNIGGDVEAPSAQSGKDSHCSGKIMIRQTPATVEDVIETRIAVVGNGMCPLRPPMMRLLRELVIPQHEYGRRNRLTHTSQSTLERVPCWESWSRETSTMAEDAHE